MKLKIGILLTGLVALSSMTNLFAAKEVTRPAIFKSVDEAAMNVWVDSLMSSMTMNEKIGQLIVAQVNPTDNEYNRRWLKRLIDKYHIGGLLYMEGTLAEQARLTNYAQSVSPIPLMVTLDGEWGLSMRYSDAIGYPRNMVLGATDDDKLMYEYGREVARQCRRVGIHVNFAPVLDVNDNPANPVIGSRSFGEDPELVSRLGIAYAKGLEDGGVLSVAKHFPGHGNSSQDSHKTLPVINKSMSELKVCEFVPFKAYIDAGLSGMLVAHLHVPAIDPAPIPSTLSEKNVTELLKEEMGFDGLVFTDGLSMKGVTQEDNLGVKALLAGNHILLGPINVAGEAAAIKSALLTGKMDEEIVEEACRKVLCYKYALGINNEQPIEVEGIVSDINSGRAEALQHKLWSKAITVVKNDAGILPLRGLDKNKIAVVTIGGNGGLTSMFQNRCEMYSATDKFDYYDGMSVNELSRELEGYDKVILAVHSSDYKYVNVLSNLTARLKNDVCVMFVSAYRTARFASGLRNASAVVLAYDDCNLAQDYAAQTVYGGNAACGELPVTVNGVGKVGDGIKYPSIRLGYGVPEEVGLSGKMITRIDSLVAEGLKTGAFPGCQVLVAKDSMIVCNRYYGVTDTESNRPVTVNTIYDLASVSKATGTISGIMEAVDNGLIDIDAKASKYIPQLVGTDKEDITIRQLLFHESGMPAALNMYDVMIDPDSYKGKLFCGKKNSVYSINVSRNLYGNRYAKVRNDIVSSKPDDTFNIAICDGVYGGKVTYDSIMGRIYNAPLRDDNDYLYSCLNFCLLMNIEENVTHEHHNDYVENNVFAPLGAYHTLYRPLSRFEAGEIAPTEYDTFLRRQLVHGYVHDETAAYSGGVQGNAGLFSNANDLAKLFQMWLNGGEYGGDRFLSKETVDLFCKTKSPNSRRGLGFDKPDKTNDDYSPTCSEATAETFGHLGFTGTCYWVDPSNGLVFIFLCNRVYPTRDNDAFDELNIRPKLFSLVYQSILPPSQECSEGEMTK